MKKIINLLTISTVAFLFFSCGHEINIPVEGQITGSDVPLNATFINTQVIAAYAMLDGNLDNNNVWRSAPSNWVYGEVTADNAYKGSEAGDQSEITQFETYDGKPINSFVDVKWRAVYEGIARCNIALNAIQVGISGGTLTSQEAAEFTGELRFLRAHYHFEAKKVWGNIPYIDETVTESVSNVGVDAWTKIEEDFQFAIDNLPTEEKRVGGATSWNAKAYLAKAHMYQLDYDAAEPLLDDVITNGPYALNAFFHDNFDADTNNSMESVFAVQYAVNDGSNDSSNGNYGDILNHPHNSPIGAGCCGFFQPSHDLVNAFKTDANGLPLFDTYNNTNINNVDPADTTASGFPDDASFVEYPGNLDPRLDWTVGRKGIPFNGWGDFPGLAWVREPESGGCYVAKKIVYRADQQGSVNTSTGWAATANAINTNIIRFSELLLWRAEIHAANNQLTDAAILVDRVRSRAANPEGWVKNDDGTDAANYVIGLYTDNGGFPDQAYAQEAILFEYRLETALEGHRFFDLVRRGGTLASDVLNTYVSNDGTRSYFVGVSYIDDKKYFPLPQPAIDLSGNILQQNDSY
ncbi:RagB/SusD family nutrient uptake outer membrane protein [Abyssalbus ytuae]|uniref:RagB/SusD family nutrient uptake outer membrane protein n=1 Tax=Abyssalbus ytuae TaxID=2926907 RepID=A0A9E7D322_9FLAO|nr:RagB/SusD family nutrient uptake outer membrane protein [Abyssalbus ytuae]UOB18803.1 RagB/SusD family nutrient uptake outer membrane protein [Abyssalbus ytuae]